MPPSPPPPGSATASTSSEFENELGSVHTELLAIALVLKMEKRVE